MGPSARDPVTALYLMGGCGSPLIHKTAAARRGGGASIAPLSSVKVFPGGTGRWGWGGGHKGSGLNSWMNSSFPFKLKKICIL